MQRRLNEVEGGGERISRSWREAAPREEQRSCYLINSQHQLQMSRGGISRLCTLQCSHITSPDRNDTTCRTVGIVGVAKGEAGDNTAQ